MRSLVIEKPKINNKILNKEYINKLSDKEFLKEFDKGNIAVEDFLEFMKKPIKFNQVEVAKKSLALREQVNQVTWFSKISSNLVKIPDSVMGEIKQIAEKVIDYVRNDRNEELYLDKIVFINPYTNQEEFFHVVLYPYAEQYKEAMAVYNRDESTITIFAYHQITSNLKKLYNDFVGIIRHEITHAIDIKQRVKKYPADLPYLSRDYEFDAICSQIIQYIENYMNNADRKDLERWMRTLSDPVASILFPFEDYVLYWKKNHPKWFTKLIQRIYNEVFVDKKTQNK